MVAAWVVLCETASHADFVPVTPEACRPGPAVARAVRQIVRRAANPVGCVEGRGLNSLNLSRERLSRFLVLETELPARRYTVL